MISSTSMDIVLDSIALFIFLIVFTSCWCNDRNTSTGRSFCFLLLALITHVLTDFVYYFTQGVPALSAVHYLSSILYFVFAYLTANLLVRYVMKSLSCLSLKKKKLCLRIIDISFVVFVVISLFLSIFKLTFHFENGLYVRGPLYPLFFVYPYSLILFCAVLICRDSENKQYRFVFLAQCIMPVLGTVFSFYVEGTATHPISNALSVILIYTHHYRQKTSIINAQNIELLNSRAETILSQIQPHFLYNTITAAVGLCEVNPDLAAEMMSNFGKYLRNNLDALKLKEPVLFSTEQEHIEVYLSLEQARFQEKLSVVWDIQTNDFLLPALSVQPLVENAVKHGITSSNISHGTVKISTYEEENAYYVVVTDNGKGFDVSNLDHYQTSIGISNVKARLAMMVNGSLVIHSQKNGGTTVTIRIPKEMQ